MFALKDRRTSVFEAPDELRSILRDYEIRVNQKINILLIVLIILSFILLISLRFSWMSYDHSFSLIPYHCLNIVFLTFTVIFTTVTEGKNRYSKYLMILSLIFVTSIINSHYAGARLLFMIPLMVCIAYRDKGLTIVTSIAIAVMSLISVLVSVEFGVLNYNYLKTVGLADGSVMINMTHDEIVISTLRDGYIPFFVVLVILSVIAYVITAKGLEMMQQKAAADTLKTAMDRELTVASEIQKGMLPSDSFETEQYSVSAVMKAAKVVGGDYYDYFMTDDRHVAVLIADVSGKGVPASLFMASAKTMMRSYAMGGQSPSEVFDSVNRSLCESNPEKMFVTAWMGILDLETGRLTYANAGHNPPFIIRSDSAEMIKNPPNFILGYKKSIRYKDYHLDMNVGDKLFLYTDGVTEAMDTESRMFTSDRLYQILGESSSDDPRSTADRVCGAVSLFTGDAEQSDDMTVVILGYKNAYVSNDDPGRMFVLNKGTYPEVISYITGCLKDAGCMDKTVTDIEICSSEILSNIDLYAYSERGDGEINVSVNVRDRTAKVMFTDFGPEYNPLKHSSPDSEKRISEHKIGGFGILIVKKMMDDVIYERKDGKNILTIKKEL